MSRVDTKKAKKSVGQEAQSALKETIKDINQAIQAGQIKASKTKAQAHAEPRALTAATTLGAFEVAYDAKGRAQVIVTASGERITARQNGMSGKAAATAKGDKLEYQHSRLKGVDIYHVDVDRTYGEVSYELKTREKRAVITEIGSGETSADLYLGKKAKVRHMVLTTDGTQVIEGSEGRLTIDPTFTKYLMQSAEQGSIYVDLKTNKMQVTFPDGLTQTYGVTASEAALLRQGPVGFNIKWLLDNNGNHRFQWSAIVAISKLPS